MLRFISARSKAFTNIRSAYYKFLSLVFALLILFFVTKHSSFVETKVNKYVRTLSAGNGSRDELFFNNINGSTGNFIESAETLETHVRCAGHRRNQSCLYKNLYFTNSDFTMLTVKGRRLPDMGARPDSFWLYEMQPKKREFESYAELEKFVRDTAKPKLIPGVTLFFGQPWHYNVGHALFDGLYPAYLALVRFPPRHLNPFRILGSIAACEDCWTEDIYSRFAGLGVIKHYVLNRMSTGRWFVFDELVVGSGLMCQRCTQPNLQLPGGVEMDGSRLFRDRMYAQHGIFPLPPKRTKSNEKRDPNGILLAYIIDNKRFTANDRKEIGLAIEEINNSTLAQLNGSSAMRKNEPFWPLINVTYVLYNKVKAPNESLPVINKTRIDMRIPTYELIENDFTAQLRLLSKMDIHITGPGTGQMYQTFLQDGAVSINVGGLRPWALEHTKIAYASFLEQYMTSGTPYIKGLYYPINERRNGIRKDEVIKLVLQAAKLILGGFSIPVDPVENLAPDGKLFVEMCRRDPDFCVLVTSRSNEVNFDCTQIWVEDFVHEHNQWRPGGFLNGKRNSNCPFNHTLLYELRQKYGIDHFDEKTNRSTLFPNKMVCDTLLPV